MRYALIAVLLTSSVAAAEPSEDRLSVAAATNLPLRWPHADSIAGSAYVGFARHHAIRLNAATYVLPPLIDLLSEETTHTGRTNDLGVGYQIYPRRLWSGFVGELGVIVRSKHRHTHTYSGGFIEDDTVSTGIGTRWLIGWSWRIADRGIVAASVGASRIRTRGTRIVEYEDTPTMRETFVRTEAELEFYLRLGIAFGI